VSDERQTHKVAVYEGGKYLGCVGSGGYINRLKVHQIPMTLAKAEDIAREITEDTSNPYTAQAVRYGWGK
jgi:hypothetical protein